MGFKRNSLKQLIKWRKALSVSTTLKFGHSRNISGLGVILAKFCVRGFTEFTFYGVEQWRNKQTALDFLSYTASLWWQRQEMVELVKFIEGNLHIERLFENLKPILSRFYYVWNFSDSTLHPAEQTSQTFNQFSFIFDVIPIHPRGTQSYSLEVWCRKFRYNLT